MPRRNVEEWFWHVGSDLQRLSEELHRSRPAVATGRCWEPRVDLYDCAQCLVLKAEIAGVRGDDIILAYLPESHSILIRGVRRESESDDERRGVYQLEIAYGEFERQIRLPDLDLQTANISGHYRNGMLTVVIPKDGPSRSNATVTVTRL